MIRYKNTSGKSGVQAYDYNTNSISIRFSGGSVYRYTVQSVGSANLERMKALADSGKGLNSFIRRNVKNMYESKS